MTRTRATGAFLDCDLREVFTQPTARAVRRTVMLIDVILIVVILALGGAGSYSLSVLLARRAPTHRRSNPGRQVATRLHTPQGVCRHR